MAYEPLDVAKKEIRLLTVAQSLSDKGQVQCSLSTVTLHEQPSFEAISWCWGDPREKAHILLNGYKHEIPASTDRLLKGLCIEHAHAPDARFWLDAVCINQEDIKERSEQVSLMTAVYSQAERVVVWLGEDTSEVCKRAISSIDGLVQQTAGLNLAEIY